MSGRSVSRRLVEPLTQISDPSPENPTLRLGPVLRWSGSPGVRSKNAPVPTCFLQTWNGPSRSAMKTTILPSGEIVASSSLPSKSVNGVNFAVGQQIFDGCGRRAPAARSPAAATRAQHDDGNGHRRAATARRRRNSEAAPSAACPTTRRDRTPDRAPTGTAPRAPSPGSARRCARAPAASAAAARSGGSSFRIAVIVSGAVSRANAGRPVSIS